MKISNAFPQMVLTMGGAYMMFTISLLHSVIKLGKNVASMIACVTALNGFLHTCHLLPVVAMSKKGTVTWEGMH